MSDSLDVFDFMLRWFTSNATVVWRRRAPLVVLVFLLAGCGKPDPADRVKLPSEVLDFDTLFTRSCTGCHGEDGTQGPAPPLNDPLFLAIASDEDLLHIATHGRPGTLMPPFATAHGGDLTEEQVQVVVHGIREKWGSQPPADAADLPPYIAQAPSADQTGDAEAGKAVFAAACAGCHGADGRGGEKAGAINHAAFLALISDQALRRIVITGREDLGMPDFRALGDKSSYAKPLTEQQITDVVALLASWRTPGAGPPERQAQAAHP